ncbi:hypothetical protein [Thermomonas sp.]|uniref:hypothetical protein n=1 Tax=Thermomonas sp. TaxID=1971895 RepID=UPI0026155017|nr:hypothetical protein [Thermomonas sp.]
MQIHFQANGMPVEFRRDRMTGTAVLVTPSETITLQTAVNPLTHLSIRLTRTWTATIAGTEVRIVKTRPLLLAGLRPHRYEVFVDGNPVATATGF